jgi:ribosomal protein S6--L-glutamate ligase
MGKEIFPSLETYLYADEKIKQTTLFYMAEIPHPRTRIYYALHRKDILSDFRFPFIGKIPRSSARGRGVFKIQNREELDVYLKLTKIAYIQEYLPHERDLRVVIIQDEPVLAYWRISSPGDFRTNLSQGGEIDFGHIPAEGVKIALEAAGKCRFNDVGVDLMYSGNRWYVIEANMEYGRKGLKMKDFDLKQVLRERLLSGKIAALCEKK